MVYGSVYESARSDGSFLPEYAMPDGPYRMVTEALETDQQLFDIVIEHDFAECAAMQGGLTESVEALNENFAGELWAKIKELLIKIKNKIISIAKAAQVKIMAFFTKDNKALMDKYSDQWAKADKTKITIKGWRKSKTGSSVLANGKAALKTNLPEKISEIKEKDKEGLKTFAKDNTADKQLTAVLGTHTTASSFITDYINKEYSAAAPIKLDKIESDVVKALGDAQTAKESIEDAKNQLTKDVDAANNEIDKYRDGFSSETDTEKKSLETAKANAARNYVSAFNIVGGKIIAARLASLKLGIKQARKAYIAGASKGAGKVTEAVLLAEDESLDEYNVDSFFDQYTYDEDELLAS